MNYKKYLKNQKLRFAILNSLKWIPDKTMIKLQYRIKLGRKLNLKNPQRFTEKLQWYKLYYREPTMHKCADKYEVRDYVRSKGLEKILNKLYGVYDTPDEIDFYKLPNNFVIKTTSGGGGQNVLIVDKKNEPNYDEIKKKLNEWLSIKISKSLGREWAYEGNNNRIIIEKYLESSKQGIIDYKFFCFDGKVEYLYVISDRNLGNNAKLGIYDKYFNKLNISRTDEEIQNISFVKPINYEQMVKYAEILSHDFPHARIDLYNIEGKIIFGEITFYDGSGYMSFNPDSFDFELGKKFKLVKKG